MELIKSNQSLKIFSNSVDKILFIMKPTVNQAFEQAVTFHREGKLEEAERLYRSILKIQPEHLDANNNLGVILQHHDKLEQAKEYYKKAIEYYLKIIKSSPEIFIVHFNWIGFYLICQHYTD